MKKSTIDAVLRHLARKGGKLGGKARWANVPPDQRREHMRQLAINREQAKREQRQTQTRNSGIDAT